MAASLYYAKQGANSDSRILLAEAAPIDLTLDTQKTTPFKLTLTPTAESDYVPYEGPADLFAVIQLTANGATDTIGNTPAQARLATADFTLKLPLNEYHDRLSGASDAGQSGLEIVADGVVEKSTLPGSVVTYSFTVKNSGPADTFIVDGAGNDAARARIVPNGGLNLAQGESKKITVGVEVPVDANDGTQLEVLLFVHAQNDPSKMAIARTKTTVTKQASEAAPDETNVLLAAQNAQKKTPGPGIALVGLAAVGAALLAARKRR
jgi:hypothetical protein